MVAAMEDPYVKCMYVDGVGNESLTAAALGIGMKERVVEGYNFLSEHWNKGSKVRIFGFSRGSLQARMLAGMMAHCGLPVSYADGGDIDRKTITRIGDEVWKFSKDLTDADVADQESASAPEEWKAKLEDNRRRTKEHIDRKFGAITFANPDIEFMGIWDTVPGLTISELKGTGDKTGGGGGRYKVRPYPNTRVIAHALALDERRNKFAPLRVGGPIDPKRTIVHEVWFPGAHSDIGGGYEDSNDLAGITFNWMHSLLFDYRLATRETRAYADATSILHHPERGRFYQYVGGKNRRIIPKYSLIDKTVFIRAKAGTPREQGSGKGRYDRADYRPVLTLDDNSTVSIAPTSDPQTLLGPYLTLNDSSKKAEAQKTVKGVVKAEELQIKVEAAPKEPASSPLPEAR